MVLVLSVARQLICIVIIAFDENEMLIESAVCLPRGFMNTYHNLTPQEFFPQSKELRRKFWKKTRLKTP